MIKEYNLEIYPNRVFVGYKPTREEILEQFPDFNEDWIDKHGCLYDTETHDIAIFVHTPALEAAIHESYHAMLFVLKTIGSWEDVDNQEPAAYLITWFFEKVYEMMCDYFDAHPEEYDAE